jgi:hypothetical protein
LFDTSVAAACRKFDNQWITIPSPRVEETPFNLKLKLVLKYTGKSILPLITLVVFLSQRGRYTGISTAFIVLKHLTPAEKIDDLISISIGRTFELTRG